jgi:Uma2 family endonuclease
MVEEIYNGHRLESIMPAARITKPPPIDYPSSDGKPMAETDLHRDWMITNIQRLERFFSGKRVYVSGNLLIYYEEGNPLKSVAPDTFVVKNCKPGRREIFQTRKEKRTPNFILETTSKTTRREDAGKKKTIYAQLNVGEYFLYDPRGDWLHPPLQGFRLVNGEYQAIPPEVGGSIISQELGVRFALEDGNLAMFDMATGERLLSQEERANIAEQRAKQLEEELARLRETSKKTNGPKRPNGK